jgi:hypothetical protein
MGNPNPTTDQLAGSYMDSTGDIVIWEGQQREVRCTARHARFRGKTMIWFVDEPNRRHVVDTQARWTRVRRGAER